MDSDLKNLFDQRLGALTPPSRSRGRRGAGELKLAAAAVVAVLAVAGGGFVLDVNAVAASYGVDCAGFPQKVQVWSQSHRGLAGWSDHSAQRAELAQLVAQSGCSPHGSDHDSTHTGTHH